MSDHFVVSARKYRPLKFEDVVGQESVTTTLQNAIKSEQLAHAYLFCGPRGVGKTTCARILARDINDFKADESGDVSTSLNIYELDAASNNSVDDIRSLVDQVRIPPQYGKYKVYIIDEVHMLSQSAFNAFLKTLEEPPPYAIFILATTEKHKILPTILSRCQIFDFVRITVNDIAAHLAAICKKENINADESALHIIAQKADGALRDALSMLDRLVSYTDRRLTYESVLANLHILDYDYYFRLTDHLLSQNQAEALLLFDEILRKGFDGGDFISGLGEHFRNLMVARDSATVSLLEVTGSLKERYLQQATLVPSSYLLNALNIANHCEVSYKSSNNKRLHIELALLKMCYLASALQLTQQSFSAEGKKNSFNEQAHEISVKKSAATTQKSNEPVAEQPVSNVLQANDYASKVSPSSGIGIVAEKNIQPEYSDKISNKSETEIINIGSALSRKVNTSLLGSVSLSDLDIEEDEDESSLKETVSAPVVTNLRENELLAAWDDYEKLTEAEKRVSIQSLLKNNRPAVEGMVVTVNLQSRLQKELFDNERMRLLEFLESKLKVSGISLMAVVDKTNPNPTFKPFTAAEKLNKMTQENPAILELQRKLDLKLEH